MRSGSTRRSSKAAFLRALDDVSAGWMVVRASFAAWINSFDLRNALQTHAITLDECSLKPLSKVVANNSHQCFDYITKPENLKTKWFKRCNLFLALGRFVTYAFLSARGVVQLNWL